MAEDPRQFEDDLERMARAHEDATVAMRREWEDLMKAQGGATEQDRRLFADAQRSNLRAHSDAVKAMKRNQEDLAKGQRTLAAAFGLTVGGITGFVSAGLRGSAQGELLTLHFQELNREIAAIFLPIVNSVISRLQELATWFRSLSEAQQDSILKWAGIVVAALGAAVMLPRIAAGFNLIGSAMTALSANPLIALIALIAALVVGTEEGMSGFMKLWEALQPIGKAVTDIFAPLLDLLGQIAKVVASVLGPAFEALGEIIKVVLTPITAVASAIGSVIRTITGTTPAQERTAGQRPEHRRLEAAGGGLEGFVDIWKRLQTAANKTDVAQSTRERQLTALERIVDNTSPNARRRATPTPAVAG